MQMRLLDFLRSHNCSDFTCQSMEQPEYSMLLGTVT